MRKIIITTAVIFFSIAGIADAAPDSNSIVQDNIEYYIQTDKSFYDLGEEVQMLYRITNLRDEEWRIEWGYPIFDVVAEEKDGENFNEIWHWSWDKIHHMGPVVVILGPQESAEISGIWPQINLNGSVEPEDHTQVPIGIYRVSGVFYPTDTKVSVPIEVIPRSATTYYVDTTEGSDDNDGLSPQTAFATIQKAIDSAYNGDTVLVTDGTYTGPGNRDIDFLGKAITVRSESGPENCIIDCNGTETDPHCGFYFHNGEDANSLLNGFTIFGGHADGWSSSERSGGGIHCTESNPTITNCIISGNSARHHGGAIYCEFSSPTITNCTISGNSARGGGGIFCWDGSPTITNCTISGNSAWGGGGIASRDSSPTITNCTFSSNSARIGGGIFCYRSSPTITNCNIIGNSVVGNGDNTGFGGGIYSHYSSPTIANCTISGNSAEWSGGGINCQNSSNATITNCTITSNTAKTGGGIGCEYISNLIITNCKITGNSAYYCGGGIFCRYDNNTTIANCTFAENSAPNGTALACDSWAHSYPSIVQLTNCILWDGGDEIWNNDSSTITITYSDIQDGYEGEGNIDADPCFVEPGYWDANDTPDDVNDDFWVEGDYYLLPDSLCIDTGDPNYIPEPNETDLDGNPRVIGDAIDMGAYETNYIQAAMKLTPQMLNCNSKGNYVKAHITLPEGFSPEDVNVNEPAWAEPMGAYSEYIKVFGNDDGLVRLEICFDREAFCDSVTETGEVEITVIGPLTTSRYFYATDTIKIKPRR